MVRLSRAVRFSLLPPSDGEPFTTPRRNPYGGWPTTAGVAAYGEIEVEVAGEPVASTGYLINITELDAAVRERVLPWLRERFVAQFHGQPADPCVLVAEASNRLSAQLPVPLVAVEWRLTPTASVRHVPSMAELVELTQSFEFSASHRLHCAEFDADTNRRIFGKCNNPNGHGHNYRLDVTAAVPLGPPPRFSFDDLEAIVDATVIVRFDHKHLNSDCPEFADTIPSVEHIARVCHDLLAEPLRAAGATLSRVKVWETEKTCCTYPA